MDGNVTEKEEIVTETSKWKCNIQEWEHDLKEYTTKTSRQKYNIRDGDVTQGNEM